MSRPLSRLVTAAVLAFVALPPSAYAAPDGLWPAGFTPAPYDCGPFSRDGNDVCYLDDGGSVELGVKFTTSTASNVVGIRIYRIDAGAVTGSLWTADGTRLAGPVAFAGSATHSWQEVMLATPVPIVPGQTYVASYRAPNADYAFQWNAFTGSALTAGSLTAPQSSPSDGNGVFCYDGQGCGGFPSFSFRDTNYWVTPVTGDTTPPVLAPHGNVSATATSAGGATVSYTDPTATDDTDPAPVVACSPASGSTFAPGATTVTCTATDASGNQSSSTFTVTVSFSVSGFLAPIGTSKTLNPLKGGSTVPVKWRVDDGAGGFIRDVGIVAGTPVATAVSCTTSALRRIGDTGRPHARRGKAHRKQRPRALTGTGVRYDADDDQYVYRWQSPKQPGTCYRVTVSLIDGSSRSAFFSLK